MKLVKTPEPYWIDGAGERHYKSYTTILQEIIARRQAEQDHAEWRLIHVEIPLLVAAMVGMLFLAKIC